MFGSSRDPVFPSGGDLPTSASGRARGSRFLPRMTTILVLAAIVPLVASLGSIDVWRDSRARHLAAPARAEEIAPPQPAPVKVAQIQPAQMQSAAPQASDAWSKMPKMKLEAIYGGPLRDTIVQRWRDPIDGSLCYLYLPITAPTSPVQSSGFIQYGAAAIGSISCFSGPPSQVVAKAPAQIPPVPAKPQQPPRP